MTESSVESRITLLRKAELFSSCTDDELRIIAENSRYLNFKKGDTVFYLGETGKSLYIIESGGVVIRKPDNENRDIDIARFLAGDCFGELDMLTDSLRNVSAEAEKRSRILLFPKKNKQFKDILEKFPSASAGILHGFLVSIAGRIRTANSLVRENSPVIQELTRQVYRDKLTGLYNKTYLEEKLKEVLKKTKTSTSLIMLKPDNFKKINDRYGHDAGDQALRIMAKSLGSFLPEEYILIRFMGNELSVMMPDAGREEAYSQAVKIREFINNIDLSEAAGQEDFRLSVSFGIAVFPEHGKDTEELIQQAHELPLIGRAGGGNLILFPEDKPL